MVVEDISQETRHRLLEAAGEVFAEHGFRAATVRDICTRAGTNVAAINYYFGDKEGLYAAVFKHAREYAAQSQPQNPPMPANTPARDRLEAFVHGFLLRLFNPGRPAWHGKLMAREMADPTSALDTLVNNHIRPNHERLRGIVRELMGPGARDEEVLFCVRSVMGQCLFYHYCRAVIDRLYPEQKFEPQDIERLAEHITNFTVGGLQRIGKQRKAVAR